MLRLFFNFILCHHPHVIAVDKTHTHPLTFHTLASPPQGRLSPAVVKSLQTHWRVSHTDQIKTTFFVLISFSFSSVWLQLDINRYAVKLLQAIRRRKPIRIILCQNRINVNHCTFSLSFIFVWPDWLTEVNQALIVFLITSQVNQAPVISHIPPFFPFPPSFISFDFTPFSPASSLLPPSSFLLPPLFPDAIEPDHTKAVGLQQEADSDLDGDGVQPAAGEQLIPDQPHTPASPSHPVLINFHKSP